MTSSERLQQSQQDLEAQYDLLSGKLSRLKEKRIIETDANTLFKLDTEIQAAERELEKLRSVSCSNCFQNVDRIYHGRSTEISGLSGKKGAIY